MIKKYNRHVLAGILAIFIIAYNWIWFNKTFTISEGWSEFYVELMNRGKVPYRDFYYFLPPLSLFEDWVIWKLSFGYFIVYRSWRLLQRVLMVEFVYYLISKRVNIYIAFISSLFTTVLLSANVYDLCGDYNQTQQLLVILMGYALLKYVYAVNNEKSRKYIWTTIVGFIGGLMFLQKQTVVLASVIVFGGLLLLLIYVRFETHWIKTIISVVVGTLIPIMPALIYLVANGALDDFIYQVYQDTSSKGGVIEIVFGKIGKVLLDNVLLILIAAGIILFCYLRTKRKNNRLVYCIFAVVCAIAGIFVSQLLEDVGSTIANLKIGSNHELITTFYNEGLLFSHMPRIMTVLFLGILFWIFYHIIICKIRNEEYDLYALVLAFTSTAAGYSSIMANGEHYVSVITAFSVIPVVTYLLFKDRTELSFVRKSTIGLVVLFVPIFVICISQKFVCAYAWWGDTEASYWEKTETVDIPSLKGYKFSTEEKKKIQNLNELISYYTDDNSVIWGFPYVKIYNLFQQNYNMNGFVPVEFYDVCPDDFAKEEAKMLAENEPDIVIWTDIPDCIETHETVYRNGEALGQRAIQKWFSDVKDTDYTLIGQVDNVFVYKLNDGSDIDYTYITRKTAKNETANFAGVDMFKEDVKLDGKGTINHPYIIDSQADLEYLRDQVNSGNSFEDCYFKQTSNIEIDSSESWEPIGNDQSYQFGGIYDGNGYSISGLYMLSDSDEDLALFGWISGTIVNLSVEEGWAGGQYVALIACNGEGRVINCYSSGVLYGYGGGGIAYSIEGGIYNCLSIINVEKGMASGISGNYSNDVINCYSNMADGVDIDSGEPITTETIESLNNFVREYNENNSDVVLLEWENQEGNIVIKSED